MKARDRRARFSSLSFGVSRACTPLTKSEEKERLLAVYNHPESGKFLSLESGILGFGIPNLAKKNSGILLSLTKKMLLKKKKPRFWISQGITSCTRLFADDMKVSWVLRDTKQDVEELGRKILLVWNIGVIEI